MRKPINILDTSALLVLLNPEGKNVTCNHVLYEIKNNYIRNLITSMCDAEIISLEEPDDKYVKETLIISSQIGEAPRLSEADLHIIALAIKYNSDKTSKITVYTDDYAIQNILSHLNIKFRHIRRRIKEKVVWLFICHNCKHIYYNVQTSMCPKCGETLTRKPIYKK